MIFEMLIVGLVIVLVLANFHPGIRQYWKDQNK